MVHASVDAGLYTNRRSRGKDNKLLGLFCNWKSFTFSKNKAVQERQLSAHDIDRWLLSIRNHRCSAEATVAALLGPGQPSASVDLVCY